MTGIDVADQAAPVTILAAESGIQVGHHTEAHWFGLTVNTDTVLATAIAAVTRDLRDWHSSCAPR